MARGTEEEARIILVHPFEIIRQSLCSLLDRPGYSVVSSFKSCDELLEDPKLLEADIVLADCCSFDSPRSNVGERVKRKTGAKIVLLMPSEPHHSADCEPISSRLAGGVTGFIDLDTPIDRFLSELDDIVSGDLVISEQFVDELHNSMNRENAEADSGLTVREKMILELVARGMTNKEIGRDLFISEHTVKAHMTSILNKLGLKNRQQAVEYYVRKQAES